MAAHHRNTNPLPALWQDLAPLLPTDTDTAPWSGPRWWWAGALDVEGLALGSLQALATALAAGTGAAGRSRDIGLTSRGAAASFASYTHLRVNGQAVGGFAPLSGFRRTIDGWVRLHANYPHHERALLTALGVASPDAVDAALLRLTAMEVEDRVTAYGGVAAAVRPPAEWMNSPAGRALQGEPWIRLNTAPAPAPSRTVPAALRGGSGGILDGLHVLDLTRVIAGPSGSRILGALGADVLRIDPPATPELVEQHIDTGFSKRSAVADLTDPAAYRRFRELLEEADVVLLGYRGGSLARFGLDPEALRADFPGLGVVSFDAWGNAGPWAARRGFDSIVQAASGIATIYGGGEGDSWRPGALPVQALDYATGLGAAAAAAALMGARNRGISGSAHLSLVRTALELMRLPAPPSGTERNELEPELRTSPSAYGELTFVPPPLLVDGKHLEYSRPPQRYGSSVPVWD
ncbi:MULTISPECIES: CoA transferase [unclassified Arthrobacter]|uniref:CoA transferase n=1 Tax=unclassified Arthrobacter TaxID=235627 RepID=UPI0021028CF0|nr:MULTISPECIES: CoA transferase [unclassified Arthrobacter]MCQ1947218.1 CoA transferase [Arthrobacter sp. zg-Y1116]MCQ1995295.1 CoA transferase [Arthrobacter sp. zg-Y1171]UWX80666.1 CoA transferase [Arthrobacter sp. zg-Y1171]